jgi:hypothetical protein
MFPRVADQAKNQNLSPPNTFPIKNNAIITNMSTVKGANNANGWILHETKTQK